MSTRHDLESEILELRKSNDELRTTAQALHIIVTFSLLALKRRGEFNDTKEAIEKFVSDHSFYKNSLKPVAGPEPVDEHKKEVAQRGKKVKERISEFFDRFNPHPPVTTYYSDAEFHHTGISRFIRDLFSKF